MRSDGFNALPVEEPTHSVGCPIMRRITGDGVELAVLDQGEGPAVLLLHGFPDSARLWRHQIPTLVDAGFRVVAPDLRGFGDSDKPADIEAYRVGKSVGDLTSVLDALEIERAHVVGHDWGAGVAWAMALMAPDRVDKLAVLSVGHPARRPARSSSARSRGTCCSSSSPRPRRSCGATTSRWRASGWRAIPTSTLEGTSTCTAARSTGTARTCTRGASSSAARCRRCEADTLGHLERRRRLPASRRA